MSRQNKQARNAAVAKAIKKNGGGPASTTPKHGKTRDGVKWNKKDTMEARWKIIHGATK